MQAFIQYSRQFTQPLTQLASMVNLLQSGVASAERVFELLDAEEESGTAAAAAGVPPLEAHGEVVFDHVWFSYDPERSLIEDLSLVVQPGETVAIVGPTGAGKTTLVNLVMRFYDVDRGRITLDGVDIASMTRAALRSRIGMVLQDTWLFEGTIRDNIGYGRPDATEDEILEAARATFVDRFVHTLPDGYDTVIDENGSNLSAGERQLLTIARAFLSDPALLILDEATSSVDTRTELLLQEAMAALRVDRTSFVIAHRLSTIRDADLILVMEDGRIVEQGSHAELLDRRRRLRRAPRRPVRRPGVVGRPSAVEQRRAARSGGRAATSRAFRWSSSPSERSRAATAGRVAREERAAYRDPSNGGRGSSSPLGESEPFSAQDCRWRRLGFVDMRKPEDDTTTAERGRGARPGPLPPPGTPRDAGSRARGRRLVGRPAPPGDPGRRPGRVRSRAARHRRSRCSSPDRVPTGWRSSRSATSPPPSASPSAVPGCTSGRPSSSATACPASMPPPCAGVLPAWRARTIARQTRTLSPEVAAYVDAHLAPFAHKVNGTRITRAVEAALLHCDPEAAKQRATEAAEKRHVSVEDHLGGISTLTAVLHTPDAVALEQRVFVVAEWLALLGDTDPLHVRQSRALALLADPQAALEFEQRAWDHVRAGTPPPTSRPTTRRWSSAASLRAVNRDQRTRPGLPPAPAPQRGRRRRSVPGGPCRGPRPSPPRPARRGRAVARRGRPRHHPPDHPGRGHERAHRRRPLRSPTRACSAKSTQTQHVCAFPWCGRRGRYDLDHIIEYVPPDEGGPPGQTSSTNLARLCRFHHRVKTHTTWTSTRTPDGALHWTSPTGATYRVDPTGTSTLDS